MSPVLVTGAGGYLGTKVLTCLKERGVQVVGTAQRDVQWPACDLTCNEAVKALMRQTKPTAVIHCAARVPRTASDYKDNEAARESLHMVENLIGASPPHIVFTSSMTVYTEQTTMPAREEDAAATGKGYAGAKRRAELALMESDILVTILRLPGLFGSPRRNGLLFNAAAALAQGEMPALPENPPLWAAIHVDDAADLCARAVMRRPQRSMILNAGYPGEMSISSVIAELASRFDQSAPQSCCAPCFEMDLSRLDQELGPTAKGLGERLDELAEWARLEAPC